MSNSRVKKQVAEIGDPESNKSQDCPQQGIIEHLNDAVYGFLSSLESDTKRCKAVRRDYSNLVAGPKWPATKATSYSFLSSDPVDIESDQVRDRCLVYLSMG